MAIKIHVGADEKHEINNSGLTYIVSFSLVILVYHSGIPESLCGRMLFEVFTCFFCYINNDGSLSLSISAWYQYDIWYAFWVLFLLVNCTSSRCLHIGHENRKGSLGDFKNIIII